MADPSSLSEEGLTTPSSTSVTEPGSSSTLTLSSSPTFKVSYGRVMPVKRPGSFSRAVSTGSFNFPSKESSSSSSQNHALSSAKSSQDLSEPSRHLMTALAASERSSGIIRIDPLAAVEDGGLDGDASGGGGGDVSPLPTSPHQLQFHQEDEELTLAEEESEPLVFRAFKEMASASRLNRLFLENPALLAEFIKKFEPKVSPSSEKANSPESPSARRRSAQFQQSPIPRTTSLDEKSASKLTTMLRREQAPSPAKTIGHPPPVGRATSLRASPAKPLTIQMPTTGRLQTSPRKVDLPPISTLPKSPSGSLGSLPSPRAPSSPVVPQSPSKYGPNLAQPRTPRTNRKQPALDDHLVHTQEEFKAIHAKIQRNSMADFSNFELPATTGPPPPAPPAALKLVAQQKPLSTAQEVVRMLYEGSSILDILSKILKEIAELTKAGDVRLFLLEPKSKNIHLKANLEGSVGNIQFSLNTGLVAEVVKTGEELHLSNCTAHPGFDASVDNMFHGNGVGDLQNTDIFPLFDSKWIIGALQLVNRKDFLALESTEENTPLSTLIHLGGIALRQASLGEREKVARSGSQVFLQVSKVLQRRGEKADRKAQIFLEFSQKVNEDLASQTVIQKLQREARSYFDCEHCFLHILSDKQELMTQMDGSGENLSRVLKIPVGVGLVGHVAKTGETILSNSVPTHPLYRAEYDSLSDRESKSVIIAPVKHKGTTLGVLQLVNKFEGEFSETDQKDFEAFIVLCSIALHNAMLFEKEARERLKLSTLLEIITDLYRHLEFDKIMQRVMRNATAYLDAERFSLFMLDQERNELFANILKLGVSDSLRMSEIRLPLDTKSIAGHVFLTGETVLVPDAYQDPRFNDQIDRLTGFKTKSILCVPLRIGTEIIGVAQILNKKEGEGAFDQADVGELETFLALLSIGLNNALLFEREKKSLKKTEALLQIATDLCQELDVDQAMKASLLSAEIFIRAERCSLFLLDEKKNELYSKLFSKDHGDDRGKEIRIPKDHGIAGFVVQSGEVVNIKDAYSDSRFNPELDTKTGFVTKNILCMPLKFRNKIIGVAQLLNKEKGTTSFTQSDISDFQSFLTLCGIALRNAELLEKISRRKRKLTLALDLLSYHSTADNSEARQLALRGVSMEVAEIERYDFDPYSCTEEGQVGSVLRMFMELETMGSVHIPFEKLCRFVLTVRKNYRPLPYHNFAHAICVANQMYKFVKGGHLNEYMEPTETLALFVACLCHDIDHRGRSNAFQKYAKTPLADLYSTSTLERHHWKHTLMILTSEGHNIFSRLPTSEYESILAVMEYAILATDLSQHFATLGEARTVLTPENFHKDNPHHRKLLHSLLMTSCDLSSVTKPFKVCKEHAIKCMTEFWEEAEDQRTNLGVEPNPMYLPERRDELARIQAGFLTGVCIPAYETLQRFLPGTTDILEGLRANKEAWMDLDERKVPFDDLRK